MSLFHREKSVNESKICGCGGAFSANEAECAPKEASARVKVLGGGCPKCNALELAAKTALEQLGMDTTIEHVRDYAEIAKYGVMTTPALVIDGKVVSYGKVLKTQEVVDLLVAAR